MIHFNSDICIGFLLGSVWAAAFCVVWFLLFPIGKGPMGSPGPMGHPGPPGVAGRDAT